MVKTGIPFILHDNTGSLSGSHFVDLYDRMNLRVSCRRRDPDGAALYEARCTTCFRYITTYLLPSSSTAPRAHLGTSGSSARRLATDADDGCVSR
jgi:hypothetical protein